MWKKLVKPNEKIGLKLTAAERELVLESVMCLDGDYEEVLRKTPTGKPVMMTLDEFEDFGGYIAFEANHTDDKKLQKKLDAIFQKIQADSGDAHGRGQRKTVVHRPSTGQDRQGDERTARR